MLDFEAAIFDLDGTLLDSMDVWRQIDIDFLGRRGFDVPADYIAAICSMSFRKPQNTPLSISTWMKPLRI